MASDKPLNAFTCCSILVHWKISGHTCGRDIKFTSLDPILRLAYLQAKDHPLKRLFPLWLLRLTRSGILRRKIDCVSCLMRKVSHVFFCMIHTKSVSSSSVDLTKPWNMSGAQMIKDWNGCFILIHPGWLLISLIGLDCYYYSLIDDFRHECQKIGLLKFCELVFFGFGPLFKNEAAALRIWFIIICGVFWAHAGWTLVACMEHNNKETSFIHSPYSAQNPKIIQGNTKWLPLFQSVQISQQSYKLIKCPVHPQATLSC